jgi:spermidine synthase
MRRRREIVDSVDTPDGRLELLRLDADGWEIRINRRTLMTSRFNGSEIALGEMACRPLADHPAPRVIVAGLGMGYTLRAVLDVLPDDAEVLVADINSVVVDWCRWRLGALCDNVLDDPRVRLEIVDVGVPIARGASGDEKDRYNAIILDLYEGPYAVPAGQEDPLFSRSALERTRVALRAHGCLAVWSEQPVASFERRLRSSGFRYERRRPRHKAPRHVVYLAWADGPRGA